MSESHDGDFRRRHSGAMRSIEPGIRDSGFARLHSRTGMTSTHTFAFSPRDRARALPNLSPCEMTRARGMPGAQCTRSLVCAYGVEYAHQYSQRRHRKHPAFPTQWFYGFLRALPGDHRFVDPVIRATRWRLANLTPASGRQNHTASPSATRSARLTLRCVHRIPPRVRDDRDTPLAVGRDGMAYSADSHF